MHPQVLKESALVEAFNLKGAIEYNMKNYEAAREAMADAPPRTEEELDPVNAPHRKIKLLSLPTLTQIYRQCCACSHFELPRWPIHVGHVALACTALH